MNAVKSTRCNIKKNIRVRKRRNKEVVRQVARWFTETIGEDVTEESLCT